MSRQNIRNEDLEANNVPLVMVKGAPDSTTANKSAQVQNQVGEVVGIMQNNIDKVMNRGEKLETLNAKTEDLATSTFQFKRSAVKVQNEM